MTTTVNKSELVNAIKAQMEARKGKAVTVETASAVLTDVIGALETLLCVPDSKVNVPGFGTFTSTVQDRGARKGRNPHTGAVIEIAAKRSLVLKWKPAGGATGLKAKAEDAFAASEKAAEKAAKKAPKAKAAAKAEPAPAAPAKKAAKAEPAPKAVEKAAPKKATPPQAKKAAAKRK